MKSVTPHEAAWLRRILGLCLLPLLISSGICATPNAGTKVIILTGKPAPDGNGTFTRSGAPVLNEAGQVAFYAQIGGSSGGTRDNTGIFRGSSASDLVQIVRAGQAPPDGNGVFGSFSSTIPALNKAGQVAFHVTVSYATGGANEGIFRGDGTSNPVSIARKTYPAPGDAGEYFDFKGDTFAFNDRGQVAFMVEFKGDVPRDAGIYRSASMDHTDMIAPDKNGNIASFDHRGQPSINNAGQVAFCSRSGIFRSDGETTTQIVSANQRAPGSEGFFSAFFSPALNDEGQAAFQANLYVTGNHVAKSIDGIYRADGSIDPVKIVLEGDAAPDGNGKFDSFDKLFLNNAGQVAFRANVADRRNGKYHLSRGIYRGDGATDLVQIAREGQATPDGKSSFSMLQLPVLNGSGQVAFLAESRGDTPRSKRGIYFFDDAFGLVAVARVGDELADSKITLLDFAAPTSVVFNIDEYSGLNDSGQVAYSFALADGRRGIAIWRLPLHAGR